MTTEEWNDKPTGEGGSWLRPCPFCGDAMETWDNGTHARHVNSEVKCPLSHHAVAVAVWNTRAPVVDAAALTPILADAQRLREFLSGEGPLDGLWFGDSGGGPAFWWRAHLKTFDALHGALSALSRGKDTE